MAKQSKIVIRRAMLAQNVTAPLGLPNPLAWAHFLGVLESFGGALLVHRISDTTNRADANDRIYHHNLVASRERL